MNDEHVTVEEAESRLPKIIPLLNRSRQIKREIETIAAGYDYDSVLLEEEKPLIQSLVSQLSQKIDDLEDLGCYIKDLDIGLIDFLSTFEGRDIFLCWKLGEERIVCWHELGEGFGSRQDIVDLSQLKLEEES